MGASATLVRTDRFLTEWGEGDSEPPPGFDFSTALLAGLKERGVGSSIETLEQDYWEHANWYFWITHKDVGYWIFIHCYFEDQDPPLWLIQLSRKVGVLRLVFGGTKKREEIDEELLDLVGECLIDVAGLETVEWLPCDGATERFLRGGR